MSDSVLPVGKLPPEILMKLLSKTSIQDHRVLLGPGVGLDCAILEPGENLLVIKTDPVTFATDEIGWYLVQITANDLATTGASPRWLLVTMLLPEGSTTPELVEKISDQIFQACRPIGVQVIGGHTEITAGIPRPILVGAMLGEVERDRLVLPTGARPGNRILLTKGVPIEATAILARELGGRLEGALTGEEIRRAQQFLYHPGISVLKDAHTAIQAGRVTAMHDPTEGGIATALWELSEASGCTLLVEVSKIAIPSLSQRICERLGIDPLGAISSGSLLLTVEDGDQSAVIQALEDVGIVCMEIGRVEGGPPVVLRDTRNGREQLPRPPRDEIARLFEVPPISN